MNVKPVVPGAVQPTGQADPAEGTGFGRLFARTLAQVNDAMQEADAKAAALVRGDTGASIHETMIAMEKASIQFRLLTKAQNKVVDAYKEIMRLQL